MTAPLAEPASPFTKAVSEHLTIEANPYSVYKDYIQAINAYFIPFFGKTYITSVDTDMIREFNDWRAKKIGREPKASTLNTHNSASRYYKEAKCIIEHVGRGLFPVMNPKQLDSTLGEARQTFEACVKTFLPKLTQRTRLVVLLGNADSYVEFTNATFARLFPDYAAFPQGEGQVFRAGGRFYVHTAHPSGSNGHFGPFIAAGTKDAQGRKCRIVRAAVAKILPSTGLV